MHSKRLLAAAVFLPLMYLYIMKLPSPYFLALLMAVSALAFREFLSMYGAGTALKVAGMLCGVLFQAGLYLSWNVLDILIAVFMAAAAMRLFLRPSPASSLRDIAPVAVGLIYIPGLMGYQLGLREAGPEWIIFLYGAVWGSDSMAYYIGKGMGKRKLYASVSPGKTVAGAVGSVAGGILSAIILRFLLLEDISAGMAALLGLAIGAVAIVGDLVESMFKRDAGVKDSGALIPGHGGMLDKIDGALFAGPALYWLGSALKIL